MPAYELTGTVRVLMDPQTFASGFTKREFVVTSEDDRYPQDIKFECVREKCSLLDEVKVGQRVRVNFDLRGREYNGRYFVDLTAWRVEDAGNAAPGPACEDNAPDSFDGPPLDELGGPEDTDDIPPF